MSLDINKLMAKMQRIAFTSEADFKFTLSRTIERECDGAQVICEYAPDYKSVVESVESSPNEDFQQRVSRIHIDILMLYKGKKIPIELKYRTIKKKM